MFNSITSTWPITGVSPLPPTTTNPGVVTSPPKVHRPERLVECADADRAADEQIAMLLTENARLRSELARYRDDKD